MGLLSIQAYFWPGRPVECRLKCSSLIQVKSARLAIIASILHNHLPRHLQDPVRVRFSIHIHPETFDEMFRKSKNANEF